MISETVWYTQYAAPAGDRNWEAYVLDTFHDIEDETVHYAFRPTPESVSISSNSNRATVRWVGVGQNWNWRHTLSTARGQQLAGVDALDERLRDAMPEQFRERSPASNSAHLQPESLVHPLRAHRPLPHAVHASAGRFFSCRAPGVLTSTRPRSAHRWVGLGAAGWLSVSPTAGGKALA